MLLHDPVLYSSQSERDARHLCSAGLSEQLPVAIIGSSLFWLKTRSGLFLFALTKYSEVLVSTVFCNLSVLC